MPGIAPLDPPFPDAVAQRLESMMPAGVPPIRLFRTFVKNLPMAEGMSSWGSYYLSKQLSLTMRDREIVIDRTAARCGCEYEWGVHVAFFADRVGFTPEQVSSIAHGQPTDACWDRDHERLLITAIDSLHEHATISDSLADALAAEFDESQLLDLYLLAGWYHAISYAANAARVECEDGAPRFADVR
jgi:alkylhydroperoxidase family enzyme